MLKYIAKLFMPSPKSLADMAAKAIQSKVNESDKKEQISKYTVYADEVTKVQSKLVDWAKDGVLDDKETEELRDLLAPMFEKVISLI